MLERYTNTNNGKVILGNAEKQYQQIISNIATYCICTYRDMLEVLRTLQNPKEYLDTLKHIEGVSRSTKRHEKVLKKYPRSAV